MKTEHSFLCEYYCFILAFAIRLRFSQTSLFTCYAHSQAYMAPVLRVYVVCINVLFLALGHIKTCSQLL